MANILMIAGETSGDALGGALARVLKKKAPHIALFGMGGQYMETAGVHIFVQIKNLSVVGLPIRSLKNILQARRMIIAQLKKIKFDLVILIDYPGFNLNISKYIKRMGIPILYYVSPQIWAWRYNRIKKIKTYVDHMAVLFAFEEPIYRKENIPVTWVGHPLADKIIPADRKTQQPPIVALLPGSRIYEIKTLLPIMIAVSDLIKKKIPSVQFILPLASNLIADEIKPYLPNDITLVQNNIDNILPTCDAAIAAAGTVTLEIALHQIPAVVIYKLRPFTYWIAKKLMRAPYMALPNLIAEQLIYPEFIQDAAKPNIIAEYMCSLLTNLSHRQRQINLLQPLREKLGHNASEKAAEVVLSMSPQCCHTAA